MDQINLDAITDAMIATAAENSDLDAALRPMMAAAGIQTGDVAGHVFSSVAQDAFNHDHWPLCSAEERSAAIREWIRIERLYLD